MGYVANGHKALRSIPAFLSSLLAIPAGCETRMFDDIQSCMQGKPFKRTRPAEV